MKMMSESRLMANADGWIDPPAAKQVEHAVTASRPAHDVLMRIQRLSRERRRAFEPEMSDVPLQRLVAVIDGNARNIREFFRRRLTETAERRCNWKAH